MEPVKSFVPLAKWLLRISLAIFIYQSFFDTFLTFSLNSLYYFMAVLFILFGVLLLLGGFLKQSTTTLTLP